VGAIVDKLLRAWGTAVRLKFCITGRPQGDVVGSQSWAILKIGWWSSASTLLVRSRRSRQGDCKHALHLFLSGLANVRGFPSFTHCNVSSPDLSSGQSANCTALEHCHFHNKQGTNALRIHKGIENTLITHYDSSRIAAAGKPHDIEMLFVDCLEVIQT